MLGLLCTLLLHQAADAPVEPEPFIAPGGIHLITAQSANGLIFGAAIYAASGNNTQQDRERYVGFAVATPLVNLAVSILAAHWARPSIVTAYESVVLGWTGFFAGFALGDLYLLQQRPPFNFNLAWPIRMVCGAVGQLIGQLVPLVPRRRDPPGWQLAATFGAAAVGTTVALVLLGNTPRGAGAPDPIEAVYWVMPFMVGTAVNVLLRVTFPETDVTGF